MKLFSKLSSLIIFVILINNNIYSQKIGVGVSAIYNFQTEGFAPGLRAEIPFGRFSIVPQVSYYASFNKVNEYYAGLSLHLNLFNIKSWTFYGLGHGSYNGWMNYGVSPMKDVGYSNWNAELGGGITTTKCLRPFIESRYNFKWKETNLRIGVMYFFGCNSKNKNAGGGRKQKKAMTCPAYD